MIDANTPIPVTLTAQQWNTVLALLDEAPRRVVNGIWLSIQQQCQQHDDTIPAGNVTVFNPASA
jgi:hypothetical protein